MTQEIAVRQPLDDLARLGQWLALSETGDRTEKALGAAAALRLYYAAELGLPPMAAAELTVIKGRLYLSAQLLRALAARAGYRVHRVGFTDSECTARLINAAGEVLGESSFTFEQAKTAGLVRAGSPWTTHPGRMLWARASKNVIVDFAPEVALGLALDDELQEVIPPAPDDNVIDVIADEIEWPDPEEEAEVPDELARMEAEGDAAA